jgi:perosamine synthetase
LAKISAEKRALKRSSTSAKTDLFAGQVPLLRPWLGREEADAVAQVLSTGWVSQGPKVIEFESAIAARVGAAHGVAVNACTSAMHLMMACSGIGAGDEVIMPSFTCMATANAIHHCGAEPVFADIDARTFNIEAAQIEAAITPNTRAIIVVHQAGLPVDLDPVAALAKKRGLLLFEDAAATLGARYRGQAVGGSGRPVAFSFHPRKMITTGEGGMVMTNDAKLAEKMRVARSTGASISDLDRHKAKGSLVQSYDMVGFNYRLTDMQAAVGLVQLGKLDAMLKARRTQTARYGEAFRDLAEIECPHVPDYAEPAWSCYHIRFRGRAAARRDEILRALAERGISCRVSVQPLHREPVYRDKLAALTLPNTEQVARDGMFLPIFPGMTVAEQDSVIRNLKAIV